MGGRSAVWEARGPVKINKDISKLKKRRETLSELNIQLTSAEEGEGQAI